VLVARLKSEVVKFAADHVRSPVCRMAIVRKLRKST
jgi:hypothetical protein